MKATRGWLGIAVTAALLVGYALAAYNSLAGDISAYSTAVDIPVVKGLTLGILLVAIISLIATKSESKG